MKKCAIAAAVMVLVMAGLGWSRSGKPVPAQSAPTADPYSSPEAQRHFHCQPRHWASMVLVFE